MNKVWKFHNDVDTDQIIASQYLLLPDIEAMKQYTFESLDLWLWFFKRAGTKCFKSTWN